MIVCHCFGTTDREIRQALAEGRATRCPAGRGCGGCAPAVQEIMSQCSAADGAQPRAPQADADNSQATE